MAAYPDKMPTMAELREAAKEAIVAARHNFITAEREGYADDEEWVNGVDLLIGYSDAYRRDGYSYQIVDSNDDFYSYDNHLTVTYWASLFVEPGERVDDVASALLSELKRAIKKGKPFYDPDGRR
jgi:hypothetical protein